MYTQNHNKKNFTIFSLINIRMSGNSINFDSKDIKKSDFYKKTLMLIKYLFLKKNHMVQKMLLNTLLGIMIIMKLNQYV